MLTKYKITIHYIINKYYYIYIHLLYKNIWKILNSTYINIIQKTYIKFIIIYLKSSFFYIFKKQKKKKKKKKKNLWIKLL